MVVLMEQKLADAKDDLME
jgi:hypothetical protein